METLEAALAKPCSPWGVTSHCTWADTRLLDSCAGGHTLHISAVLFMFSKPFHV